jgi:hypothetical protein
MRFRVAGRYAVGPVITDPGRGRRCARALGGGPGVWRRDDGAWVSFTRSRGAACLALPATTARGLFPRGRAPGWLSARRATVLVDSVLLGGVPALKEALRGWRTAIVGRPAVMVRSIEAEIRGGGGVAPLAIVGVGYNSLWEKGRRNHGRWSAEFDRQARRLVSTLRARGARQIVWVTLRDARRSVIPSNSLWQHDDYAWYFPYVNERLRALDRSRDDLVLADWAAVSDRPGVTYDAIHLDPDGAALMARTIRSAITTEAVRQAARSGPFGPACPA